jgi:hypothetical protein
MKAFGAAFLVGSLAGLAFLLGMTEHENKSLRAKLSKAEQPLICQCSLDGSRDEIAWDVDLGQVKATATLNGERFIPARAACGPLRLRAWTGVDAP